MKYQAKHHGRLIVIVTATVFLLLVVAALFSGLSQHPEWVSK